jgi:hypothetical protein
MRTNVKALAALTRLIEAVELELINTSDDEIRDAARDLGMDLSMKQSAAFSGLNYPAKPQLSDFFEFGMCRTDVFVEATNQLGFGPTPNKRPVKRRRH